MVHDPRPAGRRDTGSLVEALTDFFQFLGYTGFVLIIGAWLGVFWVEGKDKNKP